MKTRHIILALLVLLLIPMIQGVASSEVYNAGDIAVINRIIDENGGYGAWEKWTTGDEPPSSWMPIEVGAEIGQSGVYWSSSATNRRIVDLRLWEDGLEGTLDVSGLTELKALKCNTNALSALDISACAKLEELNCAGNALDQLDVSRCPELKDLICADNNISELDLTNCPKLTRLMCGNNRLSALNVSSCPDLDFLSCGGNGLGALDLSACVKLTYLWCEDNRLSALDTSKCVQLYSLTCGGNPISHLKLPAGYELFLAVAPEGAGTVQLSYDHAYKTVTLEAHAAGNSVFSEWSVTGLPSQPYLKAEFLSFDLLPSTSITATANFEALPAAAYEDVPESITGQWKNEEPYMDMFQSVEFREDGTYCIDGVTGPFAIDENYLKLYAADGTRSFEFALLEGTLYIAWEESVAVLRKAQERARDDSAVMYMQMQGQSMMDTLTNGTVLSISRYEDGVAEPQRGDVVVCRFPGREESYVKRFGGV